MELFEAHNQWMRRPDDECYGNLSELQAAVDARRAISREGKAALETFTVEPEQGGLALVSKTRRALPTHYAFGQLCTKLSVPTDFMRQIPSELAATNLNWALKNRGEDETKILFAAYDDFTEIRAFTSTTYGRIWDSEVVKLAQYAVDRSEGKFFNPPSYDKKRNGLYASDRDVFIFMIDGGSQLQVGKRADLNRGFFMWNSETGSRTFGFMCFYFNSVCGNHIVWDASNVQKLVIRHSKGGPQRFRDEGLPMLLEHAAASMAPMELTVQNALKIELPKLEKAKEVETIHEFLNKHGKFTKAEARLAYETACAEEGQCANLWDLVQGLTATARDYAHTDTRVDLEVRAGQLLKLAAN